MSNRDLFAMAFRNLLKRKLRTFLTVFGVTIGTVCIIIVFSLSIGMNESLKAFTSEMSRMQIVTVYSPERTGYVSYDNDGNANPIDTNLTLDDKQLEVFRQINGVEAVAPVLDEYFIVGTGKYAADCSIFGIPPEMMEPMGIKVKEGRALQEGDTGVGIFGEWVLQEFYDAKVRNDWRKRNRAEPAEVDVYNDKFVLTFDWSYGTKYADPKIKPMKLEGIGVMSMESEYAYSIIMPYDDVAKMVKDQQKYYDSRSSSSNKGYSTVWVKGGNLKNVQQIQREISDMGFYCYSSAEWIGSIQDMINSTQGFLGFIGGVALFVAAIGIANTMIMSIYERTKEIGVMKVIGATIKDIRRLFLTEAALIGFFGGIFGNLFSFPISLAINYLRIGFLESMSMGQGGKMSMIPLWLVVFGMVFATMIGIISGFFPARRAMKLSALSAMHAD